MQLVKRRQFRGAEVFAVELSDRLATSGHEVLMIGIMEPVHDDLRPERAAVEDVGGGGGGLIDLLAIWRLGQLLRRFCPDIVQANGSDTLKYSIVSRRVVSGSWPIVYRNIGMASDWLRGTLHRRLNTLLVREVDRVVSVSHASCVDFSSVYGYPKDRITVIPQSTAVPPIPEYAAARNRLLTEAAISGGSEILIHVGSFTPEKNHEGLLHAFREIVSLRPATVLVLIGAGPGESRIRDLAGALGLRDRVHFAGARADAAELIGGADLLVLPSTSEGTPAVILEAGARCVPVVATAVGGIPEIVRHGETGLLVEPGDRAALISAVLRLLGDSSLRTGMGRAARETVSQKFSLNQAVTGYESVYQSLHAAE